MKNQRRFADFRAVLIEETAIAVISLASCIKFETFDNLIFPDSTSNSIQ